MTDLLILLVVSTFILLTFLGLRTAWEWIDELLRRSRDDYEWHFYEDDD